jgi:Uma2 family endonuclease
MQALDIPLRYTPAEYLALEAAAPFRSEYHDGEIIPMAGSSLNHNRIVGRIWALLIKALQDTSYEAFSSDVRVWITNYRKFTYPDVMVIQGEPVVYENREDTLTNPRLIIEVLSKSTQDYDKTDKFRYYRSLPDLQEYVLVNQYALEIQQYQRSEGGFWLYRAYESAAETVTFASIDLEMTVAEIYQGVTLAAEPVIEPTLGTSEVK